LDLASRNAASVFGLDHLKGRIEVGLDADLAIWDPAARWTIRHADLRSAVDFTPYEGRETTGRPMTVLVRGVPVVSEGVVSDAPGFGRFVPRRPADPATFPPPIEDTAPWLDT
jgi:dihydropyrimidinase